jgi:phenylalanyl-tRNA synthetase beta chain
LTPDISSRLQTASIEYINRCIGVEVPSENIVALLNRMSLPAELVNSKEVRVSVPPTRSDILHACDIMEDVAIGYGFNNIPRVTPNTVTAGKPQPLSKLSDLLRDEVAHAGYTEVLTWCLCSKEDNFKLLNRPDNGCAVLIGNPKTPEFQCGRLTLLSGLLKSVSANKRYPLPIHLFEMGDIIRKDATTDTGASNKRVLTAIYCNTSSGFEIIHGLLDRIMLLLRVPNKKQIPGGYFIKQSEDPTFFPGQRADVFVDDKKVAVLGVVHPEVLKNYEIPYPCSALEIEIDVALAHFSNNNKQQPTRVSPPIQH